MTKGLDAKVVGGSIYVAAQTILMSLAGFVFYATAARCLTSTEIGKISLLSFILSLLMLLSSLSLPVAATKYISQYIGEGRPETAASVASATQKIVFASSAVIVTCSLPILLIMTGFESMVLIFTCLAAFVAVVAAVYACFLKGLNQFGEYAVSSALGSLTLGRVLGSVFIVFGFGLVGVVFGWLVGGIVGALAAYSLFRGRLPKASNMFDAKTLFAFSTPLCLLSVFSAVFGYSDMLLLLFMTGECAGLGVYDLAVRALAPAGLIATSTSTTLFPALSEIYGRGGEESFSKALSTSTRYLTMLVSPVCFGLAIVSEDYLTFLFGWKSDTASLSFSILCIVFILYAYAALFTSALRALGKTRSIAKVWFTCLGINLLFAYILIPPLNVLGAALSRAAMFVASFLLMLYQIEREVDVKLDLQALTKSLMSTLAMAGILVLTRTFLSSGFVLVNLGVAASIGFVVYIVSLLALKGFRREDFDLLRRVLPKPFHPVVDLLRKLAFKAQP